MIKYLYLENFKAITRKRFDFNRINVFCGPNNSGKSSVLAALNLVAQSVVDNLGDAALIFDGRYDDLGTFQDLVFAHNIRSKIVIELGIDEYVFRYDFKYRSQRREVEITYFGLRKNNKPVYSYTSRKDSYEITYKGAKITTSWGGQPKRRPTFNGLIVRDADARDARMERYRSTNSQRGQNDKEKANQLKIANEVAMDMSKAFFRFKHAFDEYDSLGAFRERPIRTYLFSGQSPRLVGKTGAGAIDLLVSDSSIRGKKSKQLVENISNWFQKTGMAEGIEITPLTSRHFEICIKDQGGGKHNICDVGFGCSQVLPVLVACYSFAAAEKNRPISPVLVVQEPEIHLHPDAQAELGSIFSGMSSIGQIFVETHSPYLVIRLQTEIAKGALPQDSMKVFYVQKISDVSEFSELNVGNDGIFIEEWPNGFFTQRHKETLELARQSSKALSKKN